MEGTCMFCGQMRLVEANVTDQLEADRIATESCSCPGALDYRRVERKKKKVRDKISYLFPELKEASEEGDSVLFMLLYVAAEQIILGNIENIKVSFPGGTKAAVSMKSDGQICIERTLTKKQKLSEND